MNERHHHEWGRRAVKIMEHQEQQELQATLIDEVTKAGHKDVTGAEFVEGFLLFKQDPHGFWRIHRCITLPEELKRFNKVPGELMDAQYTSKEQFRQALNRFLNREREKQKAKE